MKTHPFCLPRTTKENLSILERVKRVEMHLKFHFLIVIYLVLGFHKKVYDLDVLNSLNSIW